MFGLQRLRLSVKFLRRADHFAVNLIENFDPLGEFPQILDEFGSDFGPLELVADGRNPAAVPFAREMTEDLAVPVFERDSLVDERFEMNPAAAIRGPNFRTENFHFSEEIARLEI